MANNTISPRPNSGQLIPRATLVRLLGAALQTGSTRFARQASLSWLAYFPGDLPIKLLYGRAELESGNYPRASRVISDLCQQDPEYLEAWVYLARALQGSSIPDEDVSSFAFELADCRATAHALGGNPQSNLARPAWSETLLVARKFILEGDLDRASEHLHNALLADPLPPLVAITHLEIAGAMEMPNSAIRELAGYYQARFPQCIAPTMILADALMMDGDTERAVASMHHAASLDVTGQVAIRLWGLDHRYLSLWPDVLEAPLTINPPAEVAAVFGWNRLPSQGTPMNTQNQEMGGIWPNTGERETDESDTQEIRLDQSSTQDSPALQESLPLSLADPARRSERRPARAKPLPESLRSVQAELERIAGNLKRNQLARADGRFPVYVIMTTRAGLDRQYGSAGAKSIDLELQRFASVVSSSRDWGAVLLYADDPDCTQLFGLSPAKPADPWGIKLLLSDLDSTLAQQGEMIAALLIVGGPEIVPFHRLPNPVDDVDAEVLSDNPYATRDENYFIPEWPVGRLPGGCQSDPTMLTGTLRKMSERHFRNRRRLHWFRRLLIRINPFHFISLGRPRTSWGITAAIWRRASLSVFRPVGDPASMSVSPPVQAADPKSRRRKASLVPPARISYFNLHGLQDASEWFGQRDPMEPAEFPDYPVALRPQDVVNGGRAPSLVFTEACYGANIAEKSIEQALALKFLASGSQGVVGSTSTSYGSITTPLIAADLLGHALLRYLHEGLPVGEALRRAKIHLAKEMHHRQGYLDGEDQKTLISFLLYGDPLGVMEDSNRAAKSILRSRHHSSQVKLVCDNSGNCKPSPDSHRLSTNDRGSQHIPAETMAQVKQVVEQYLPGFRDAEIRYSKPHLRNAGQDHKDAAVQFGAKSQPDILPARSVITLRKQVKTLKDDAKPGYLHQHFARLTLDGEGKVIKMAISR